MYQDILEALQPYLTQTHPNQDQDGNHWWPHKCLFHSDHKPSATFCEETGWVKCFAEGQAYPPQEVQKILGLPVESSAQRKGRRLIHRSQTNRRPSASHPTSPEEDMQTAQDDTTSNVPEAIYPYVYPDGALSHLVYRFPGKVIRPFNPHTQRWQRPPNAWPIYGDRISEHLNLLILEGEKAVDAVNILNASYRGGEIRALTCGSAVSHKNHARDLAARIKQLNPKNLVVYPDQDQPGVQAMRGVCWALDEIGVPYRTPPLRGRLPKDHGDGLDDLVHSTEELEAFYADLCSNEFDRRLQTLEAQTPTFPARLILLGNRLAPITDENVALLYGRHFGEVPSSKQIKQLRVRFDILADHPSHQAVYRFHPTPDALWWRSEPDGWAYRVDARGIQHDQDPPGVMLFASDNALPALSEHPHPDLWPEFMASFGLQEYEQALIEAWLVCALTGQETPILLFKSPPNTGKSTLARFLIGLIEPSLPGFTIGQRGVLDERSFFQTLRTSPALLLDNVSSLSGESEDLLSRLATGHTVSLRPLYSDQIEHLHLRRALIMTSTNYDPYKGDLASRLILVQPRVEASGYDADEVQRLWLPHINGLRGYAFNLCQRFYARHRDFEGSPTEFRIGSLGRALLTLGYDLSKIAAQEQVSRRNLTSIEDERFQVFVDFWEAGGAQKQSTSTLLEKIDEDGLTGKRLAMWISEKAGLFELHGFRLRHVNSNGFRGYEFLTAR